MLPLSEDLSELFDIDEFAQTVTWVKNNESHTALGIMQSPEILVRLGVFSVEDTQAVLCLLTKDAEDLSRDDTVTLNEIDYRVTDTLNDQWGVLRLGLCRALNNENDEDEVFEWQ